MSHETPTDTDTISDEEFTDLLVDGGGTTIEAIERGAVKLEIASPEEATVVDE